MDKAFSRYECDHRVNAEIAMIYHEFVASSLVATQMRNYDRHQPLCETGLVKIEPYQYAVSIASGKYLVNGAKPSNQHRIVESRFYKNALNEYRTGIHSGGPKRDQKIRRDDLIGLSEAGARLGVDLFLNTRFKAHGFTLVQQEMEVVDADPVTDETTELALRFLLRKDMAYYPAIEDDPRPTVLTKEKSLLPLETMDGQFIDGVRNDPFSINFAHKHKLLHVGARMM